MHFCRNLFNLYLNLMLKKSLQKKDTIERKWNYSIVCVCVCERDNNKEIKENVCLLPFWYKRG